MEEFNRDEDEDDDADEDKSDDDETGAVYERPSGISVAVSGWGNVAGVGESIVGVSANFPSEFDIGVRFPTDDDI